MQWPLPRLRLPAVQNRASNSLLAAGAIRKSLMTYVCGIPRFFASFAPGLFHPVFPLLGQVDPSRPEFWFELRARDRAVRGGEAPCESLRCKYCRPDKTWFGVPPSGGSIAYFTQTNDKDYSRLIREKFHKVSCQSLRNSLNSVRCSIELLILGLETWQVLLMPLFADKDENS